jgi:2-polyprenyl-6-methoxyphenol hydroxylase-like FAD-dependent oxidoreductase
MAIEDAVVLKTLLQRHQFQTSVLEAFGTARYPVCRFVQDASRKVGEAGAIEDAASCLARNHNMQQKAQLQVDQFYQQLETLNSFKGVTPNHHQETKQ